MNNANEVSSAAVLSPGMVLSNPSSEKVKRKREGNVGNVDDETKSESKRKRIENTPTASLVSSSIGKYLPQNVLKKVEKKK
jgi:hypothetical protein